MAKKILWSNTRKKVSTCFRPCLTASIRLRSVRCLIYKLSPKNHRKKFGAAASPRDVVVRCSLPAPTRAHPPPAKKPARLKPSSAANRKSAATTHVRAVRERNTRSATAQQCDGTVVRAIRSGERNLGLRLDVTTSTPSQP